MNNPINIPISSPLNSFYTYLYRQKTLPTDNLFALFKISNGITDSLGESAITYQVGEASNWISAAIWGFEYSTELAAIDTLMGGGVLFSGNTPIYRRWSEWFFLAAVNSDYLWIGQDGVAIYTTDQTGNTDDIERYLDINWPNHLAMLDDLEMLETLELISPIPLEMLDNLEMANSLEVI